MKPDEYKKYDGLGLAVLVARGETTASELLEAAIEGAAAVNPRLNAIVVAMHDVARARAKEPLKGPFAGVPFLTKDLFQEYAVACATSVDAIARETGCGKAGFELDTLAMAAVGAAIGAKAYAEACQRWNE